MVDIMHYVLSFAKGYITSKCGYHCRCVLALMNYMFKGLNYILIIIVLFLLFIEYFRATNSK